MPWLLVDVALVLLALVVLGLLGRRLWQQLKQLTRAVRAASDTMGPITAGLARAHARDERA